MKGLLSHPAKPCAGVHTGASPEHALGEPTLRNRLGHGLTVAFDIGLRHLYPIDVRGLEHFTCSPSTLVVSNHRRDSDGPIIASVLLRRRSLRVQGVRPCFVAREDLFRRGFLDEYLKDWPVPVRRPLSGINLRPFLEMMQAFPMRRVPERTLSEVLEEVLTVFGDLPLDEVLRPCWTEKFEQASGTAARRLRVRQVLARRRYKRLLCQQHGLSKLSRRRFQALLPYERAIIEAHLQHFTRLLEQGATLLLEPEGAVSLDGRFGRLRAGLHALLNRPHTSPRVLPVGITYDLMTDGPKRVFVNVGPEMDDLRGLSRRETDTRVAAAIRARVTVTCSQLASGFLFLVRRNGERFVMQQELEEYVGDEAARYARNGLPVDARLLEPAQRHACIAGYVRNCVRRRILMRSRGRLQLASDHEGELPCLSHPGGLIGYMHNELSVLRGFLHEATERSLADYS
jgi:1-acyl-sn-glycerol-3-phosphate acyltransferase